MKKISGVLILRFIEDISEFVCNKQEIMRWISNYMPQNITDVIPQNPVSTRLLPVYHQGRCSQEEQHDAK